MDIQKPTVLDIARANSELNSLAGARIVQISTDLSREKLNIQLADPELVLIFEVTKRFAFVGKTPQIPSGTDEIFRTLAGYRIERSDQINLDRILKLELEKKDRLGRSKKLFLVLEVIPGKGNAILTDEDGSIKGSLKKKEATIYTAPDALKKQSILNFDDSKLAAILEAGGDPAKEIYGLSQRDIINLGSALKAGRSEASLALREYAKKATAPGPAWKIISDGTAVGYSLVEPVLAQSETAEKFDSALEMYPSYYGDVSKSEKGEGSLDQLSRILDKEIEKTSRKISAIDKDLAESEKAAIFRSYGDLILTNIDKIHRGMKSIRLENMESSPQGFIEIALDPAKSASANAGEYFRQFKKTAASQKTLTRRLKETREYLGRLEKLKSESSKDPDSLRSGLQRLGLIASETRQSIAKRQIRRLPYRRFIASCGWEILVGRSNADNDELTFHIASKEDFWFHAWQAAGSHTVLKLPNKSSIPDKKTLLEAASLAAWFSKARGALKVPVIFTQAKYVRKPRKFPPGKVLVEREKQLVVKPAEPREFEAGEDR